MQKSGESIKIKLASWDFQLADILHLQLLHILLLKQTHNNEYNLCEPDFAILLYPVISFDTTFAHIGSRNKLIGTKPTADKTAFFSNELQVTTKTPPYLLYMPVMTQGVPVENSVPLLPGMCKE
jgi:hypothetical protein